MNDGKIFKRLIKGKIFVYQFLFFSFLYEIKLFLFCQQHLFYFDNKININFKNIYFAILAEMVVENPPWAVY